MDTCCHKWQPFDDVYLTLGPIVSEIHFQPSRQRNSCRSWQRRCSRRRRIRLPSPSRPPQASASFFHTPLSLRSRQEKKHSPFPSLWNGNCRGSCTRTRAGRCLRWRQPGNRGFFVRPRLHPWVPNRSPHPNCRITAADFCACSSSRALAKRVAQPGSQPDRRQAGLAGSLRAGALRRPVTSTLAVGSRPHI